MAEAFVLNDKKTLRSWAMFDWANSVYALVISTAVFPPYFTSITNDTVDILGVSVSNTALYSFVVSAAYLLISLILPILSGISDYGGKRMLFLRFFTLLGGVSCILLYFFSSADMIWLGAVAFLLATIGFAGGLVFYNAYLPEIASEDRVDKVSAMGYAYGYIGSVICLLMILAMIMFPSFFGFTDSTIPVRIGFVMVGIWWIGWAQFSFRNFPKDKVDSLPRKIIGKGYKEVAGVLKKIRKQPMIRNFLVAFFFYIAGVYTVIYVATVFAETVLGFESQEMIITVLIIQLLAIGGSYFFAYISSLFGNKTSLLSQLIIWILICIAAYFVNEKMTFYLIAGCVGLVIGGIQSMSRSSYSKMLEGEKENASYFSFFELLRNIATVSGTFIFGFIDAITNNMRYSVLGLIFFFVVGMILLSRVKFDFQSTNS